jgi:two-component system sensor histidine kinase/response regulator
MNRWSKTMSILLLGFALAHAAGAQPMDIARLRRIMLEKQASSSYARDTSYIDVLDSLAYGYYRISADSLFAYSRKALAYARGAGYGRGESVSLRVMGNGYALNGDYTNMLSAYQQSLAIAEKINNPMCIAKATINMAAMYYTEVKQWDESLLLIKKAGEIFESLRDSLDLVKALTSSADIWLEEKQYDKAWQNYQRCLIIAKAMKNDYLVVTTNYNIGLILFLKGLYKESLPYSLQTMDYFSHTEDKMRIARTAITVAETNFYLARYPAALKYARQGLETAAEIKAKLQIKNAEKILAEVYDTTGDIKNALKFFKLYKDLSDSLLNEDMLKKTAKMEAGYEYEKKEARLKLEQQNKDAMHQHTVRIKELEITMAALLILLLSVTIFVLFRSRATKQRINQILLENNEKIERQAIQLFMNNREKDKLFSIVAHDLKMPMYSLRQMLTLLKEDSLSEAKNKILIEELKNDVDYSAELLSNLLFWAGSQMDGIAVSPIALPLHHLVQDTVRLFARQASEKKLGLKNELPAGLSAWADKTMIEVVLRNLVSNSIKFCNPGGTIMIEGKTMKDSVEICVADTGNGIEEDVLKMINLKQSVTTLGTSNERGTGLGLLLCREFVEANQGLFRVESMPGKGSKFYFRLPIIPA